MNYPVLAALFLLAGAGSLYFLPQLEKRERVQTWNQFFLDQLVTTTSPARKKEPARVTLLRVRPEDLEKGGLASRLNWAVLLDSLLQFKPQAAGIVPPLRWDDGDLLTEGALANRVKEMPPMALGAILSASDSGASAGALPPSFPTLQQIKGDPAQLVAAHQVATMPDDELLINGRPSFTHIELLEEPPTGPNGLKMPLVCRLGDRVVPSFPLQLVMLQEGLLPDDIVVNLEGARPSIQIGDSLRVPIDSAGRMEIYHGLSHTYPQIDFASLTLAVSPFQEVAEELRKATQEELESLRTNAVVIGLDNESLQEFPLPSGAKVSRTTLLTMAVSAIQSGFHVTSWSVPIRYGSWGAVALLGLFVLSLPRWLSMFAGLGVAALYLGASWLVFHQTLSWTPPWGALALCALMTLFGILLPRKTRRRRR